MAAAMSGSLVQIREGTRPRRDDAVTANLEKIIKIDNNVIQKRNSNILSVIVNH